MPETRLHINLTEGIIEAEGDVGFVKQVYADFKDKLAEALGSTGDEATDDEEDENQPSPRKASSKAQASPMTIARSGFARSYHHRVPVQHRLAAAFRSRRRDPLTASRLRRDRYSPLSHPLPA